ncbi:riboflavin synthase [Teredinibacter sp. KSP-S5-2]|uniref:riboflavin synthase n=1 Tax=Teredinibacter sp. KSP-S5-2 TaxID=3034506 RepID=UPI002934542F|nr:riboflavin synthase [Teredinibacter sp. KSP-S5-2]WNO09449.1 riboflavin synthase [Teredinibacter sp. KSP-S5-2]
MFTGIIQATGEIVSAQKKDGDLRLHVQSQSMDWSDVALGDSIATNGVCLTAVELPGNGFVADVSVETLDLTCAQYWKAGTRVNLEKALTPESRLGGHIVSGHVDGVGEVISRAPDARSERFQIRAPKELAKYIAHKGSITVDGTSLTVNKVSGAVFDLNIVPHTLQETIMATYSEGTKVNLEVDVIARYLERLLLGEKAAEPGEQTLSMAFLAEHGFVK